MDWDFEYKYSNITYDKGLIHLKFIVVVTFSSKRLRRDVKRKGTDLN